MALMKTKIKRYLKEVIIFVTLLFVIGTVVSFFRTNGMKITDNVCNRGVDLVYFWATWCPVCKMTSGNVERVAQNFDVLAIAVRSGDDAEVLSYMQKQGVHFRVINDKDGSIAKKNGVNVFPTIVFCKEGRVNLVEAGYISTLGLWLRALIFS